jgi:DNA-binding CsgD family transcriptional regulator
VAAWHLGRLETCRDALRPVARRCGGASGITTQVMLAFDAFHTGRWTEAEDVAREALTSCDAQGYRLLAAHGRHCLALVAAARGDDAAVSALSDDMIGWAVPRGARTLVADAAGARALAALGRGEFEEAYHEAADVRPPGDLGRGRALWSAMDLVEAAVRTHRPREAAAHVAALGEVGASALSPRLALHAAAATAMAAADGIAGELYEAALRLPGIDRSPFDVARVRLAYGQHLRRARATTTARTQLSAAFDAFAGLGAQPWTTRTSVELRATGQDPVPGGGRGRAGPASLTAQEWEVASLAASGMTNRQIAERLGLSSRTVDAHLYRAFPKLGITGRAGLRDALDRATD